MRGLRNEEIPDFQIGWELHFNGVFLKIIGAPRNTAYLNKYSEGFISQILRYNCVAI